MTLLTVLAFIIVFTNGATTSHIGSLNSQNQKDVLDMGLDAPQNERLSKNNPSTPLCQAWKPYYEKISKLCYDSCPQGFLPVQSPIKSCERCSSYIENCFSCQSKDTCTQCIYGYQVNGTLNGCVKSNFGSLTKIRKLQGNCQEGQFTYQGFYCVSTCPEGVWKDQELYICVMNCQTVDKNHNPFEYSCVRKCPQPLFLYNPKRECVELCPSGYFGDGISRNCTETCPLGSYADFTSSLCVVSCSGGTYSYEQTRSCVTTCSEPFYASSYNNVCTLTCMGGYFSFNPTRQCLMQCPDGYFKDGNNAQCSTGCPSDLYADINTKSCIQFCPTGTFGDPITTQCMTQCSSGLFADMQTHKCTSYCPENLFGQPNSATCVQICPVATNLYADNMTRTCVNDCPLGSFAQNMTRICVASCWNQTFGDNTTNRCVKICPQTPSLFASPELSLCVALCPFMSYGDMISRTCVQECPLGFYRQNSTAMCVNECLEQANSFADNATGYCAAQCSVGTWGDFASKRCVVSCPSGTFGYSEMGTCVQMCSSPFYGDPTSKLCVLSCPSMYNGNETTRICESSCSAGMWTNLATLECFSECPIGLFGYPQSMSCVPVCPAPYFADSTLNKCVTQCSEGYYGNPIISKCVNSTECMPKFGVNATGMCEDSCPDNQWKNENVSRCDACHQSCQNCSGPLPNNCLACKNDSFYLSTTMECTPCSLPCSTCQSSSTCLTCVDGFYLIPTNECLGCNIKCMTCATSAQNCTSCPFDRILDSASTCVCQSGFEDPQGNCASLCTDKSCDSCPTDKNVCTQCKASFVLTNGSCKCPTGTFLSTASQSCMICHQRCASCSGPSLNQCTECNSRQNRQLNKTAQTCDCKVAFYAPNNETICIKEPMPACPNGFIHDAAGVFCQEICGDGKLYNLECDDGNFDNFDGCDINCKVEANFSCSNKKLDEPTICSYKGQIIFELISALKDKFGNVIKLEYRMVPQLKYYDLFPDFKKTLKVSESIKKKAQRSVPITASQSDPSSPFNIISALYSSSTKTLLVDVGYTETASGKTLKIDYTPDETDYSHAMEETSYEWPIQVSNGLSLIYFPDNIYSQAKTLDTIILAIYAGSLILFVLAVFFRKMIGIEMIILIQTQVLSLSMLTEIHPTLGVLTEDKYAFGYNKMDELMNLKTTTESQNVGLYKAINFSLVFGENVNIMLFVVCLFYFLAGILRVAAIGKRNETGEKLKKAALVLAREIAFGFLLFSMMNMLTSYALEGYSWSIWNFAPEYSGVIKIVSIITIISNYVVYGMNFKDSIESYVFYTRNSKVSQLQPLFIATKAILIAVGIALYTYVGRNVLYALMALQIVYIIFVIVIRPFSKGIDLARSIILELSLLFIFVSRYLLISYVNLEAPGDWTGFLESGLLAEYGVAGASLLISFISFIYHLFKVNGQISPEKEVSQNGEDKKAKDMNESNIQIHHYIQDDLEINGNKNSSGYGKTFRSSKAKFHNSSALQMINLSDGEGYDSKRKLNQNGIGGSMEVIQMDE